MYQFGNSGEIKKVPGTYNEYYVDISLANYDGYETYTHKLNISSSARIKYIGYENAYIQPNSSPTLGDESTFFSFRFFYHEFIGTSAGIIRFKFKFIDPAPCIEITAKGELEARPVGSSGGYNICIPDQEITVEFCHRTVSGHITRVSSDDCEGSINNGMPQVKAEAELLLDPQLNVTSYDETNNYGYYSTPIFKDVYSSISPTIDKSLYIEDCGITFDDVLQVQYHILGIAPFTQKYQWRAADVNNSNIVNATDLSIINKIRLGIDTKDAYWAFVTSDDYYPTGATSNPLPLDDTYILPKSDNNLTGYGFKAIKLGDIDQNCDNDCFTNRSSLAETHSVTIKNKGGRKHKIIANYAYQDCKFINILIHKKPEDKLTFSTSLPLEGQLFDYGSNEEGTLAFVAWIMTTPVDLDISRGDELFTISSSNEINNIDLDKKDSQIFTNTRIYNLSYTLHDASNYSMEEYRVYPNPTKSQIFIEDIANKEKIKNIYLYDAIGRVVDNYKALTNDNALLLPENLVSGNYFLLIKTANNSYSYPIFVKD